VLLGSDGVFLGHLEDLYVRQDNLKPSRSALVLADSAADDDRGFLGQPVERLEQGVVLGLAEGGGLDEARAVAEEEEADLAAGAFVVDPAADFDVPVLMGADVLDVDPLHDAPNYKSRFPGGQIHV